MGDNGLDCGRASLRHIPLANERDHHMANQTVHLYLDAEINVDVEADEDPKAAARRKLDAFREAVLPSLNYGIVLTEPAQVFLIVRRESDGPVVFEAIYPNEEAAEAEIEADLEEWPGLTRRDYEIKTVHFTP
jgi:hypothetical protein